MKRGLILLLSFIMTTLQAFTFELVLPREKKSTVNTNYAFFVGKAGNSESIVINDQKIYIAPNGAFAHSVKLHDGDNRVVIRSSYNTQVYRFFKNKRTAAVPEAVCDFDIKRAVVKKDNTPLRSTPVDAGMNRISHLFKDTTLLVNGSKSGFYRVFLAKDQIAWIAMKDVEVDCSEKELEPATFITMDSKKYKNAAVQTVKFTRNLPYTIEEREKEIVFRIYNPELSDSSVYTVNMQKPDKYTYNTTLKDGLYTFKVNAVPECFKDCTIVVDAGHGGTEKGAIGCLGDEEKNINLRIALELAERLKLMGANVILTRECDGNTSLEDRVKIAKNCNANIFVSVHLNSIGDIPINVHKNKGTSVYYYNPNSKRLAECVEKTVTQSAGTRKDGVRTASFAVIRPTEYVGILVETAYMTNPCDSVLYTSENFAYNAAKGIADGILEFVGQ